MAKLTYIDALPTVNIMSSRELKTTKHQLVLKFDGQVFYRYNFVADDKKAKSIAKKFMKPIQEFL